ncbi:MAG: hypothetical protein H7Y13_03255 [Sphingobacteriaceae bacterium]|nr:hypothetical protein [Sphingobacteriaceae bacterium]
MKDKDLLVVIAEMLRKQDQQTEILTNLVDVSLKQFEQQQHFNEKFLSRLDDQQHFNEKFLEVTEKMADRLDKIEKKL